MKKNLLLMFVLLLPILMQSCHTTKTITNERVLSKQLEGTTVEYVVSQLGEPDEIQKSEDRYTYTYYYAPQSSRANQQYTIVNFGNDDFVKSIQSTRVEQRNYFSIRKTLGLTIPLLFFTLIVISVASY